MPENCKGRPYETYLDVKMPAGASVHELTAPMPHAKVWSPDAPNLYRCRVTVEESVKDALFGCRNFSLLHHTYWAPVYRFKPLKARWLRIVGRASDRSTWNSIWEVEGKAVVRDPKTVTASGAQKGYPATFALDGKPDTRWAVDVDAWIQFELDPAVEMRELTVGRYVVPVFWPKSIVSHDHRPKKAYYQIAQINQPVVVLPRLAGHRPDMMTLWVCNDLEIPVCGSLAEESSRERANVIFIMAEDHAPYGLSCYGSKILKTPNIDRLATDGMRFTHAVGVNSLCAPARAALLTGKHSHINGKRTNAGAFNGKQQTFPKLLRAAGYETAIVGKWHLGTEPTGFDFYKVMRGHGNYFNCEFRETGKGWHREKGYLTDVITDRSIDWLENREKGKPFYLMVHHKAPHGPDIHKEEHAKLFEDVTIPAPATLHDDWETREVLRTLDCPSSKLVNCC